MPAAPLLCESGVETADGELYVQAGNGFANEAAALREGGSFQMGLGIRESSGSVSSSMHG